MLNQIYIFFEILSFIVSIVQFSKFKNTQYKYFVPFLLFIVIYEYGTIENWFSIKHTNLWAANISMFIFFLFFSVFLLSLVKTEKFKKWITGAILLSVFFSILNIVFVQGFWKLDTITILFQFAILIVLTFVYFYELMNYAVVQISIISLPGFWLNTGLLFFCLANFLLYASFAFLADKKIINFLDLFAIIANLAIAILYSCLTISFLCFRKTSSQS